MISGSPTGDISPRVLTLNGDFIAGDKDYDGTTDPDSISDNLVLGRADAQTVIIGQDDVEIDTVTFEFDSADVALDFDTDSVDTHLVSITGFTLRGDHADFYTTSLEGAPTDRASIRPLQVQVTLTNTDKIYDGAPTATPTFAIATVNSDTVTVTGLATYVDGNGDPARHVGTYDIVVDAASVTLGDDAARNYRVSSIESITGEITRKQVTITGLVGEGKTYDAQATASVTPDSSPELLGVIESETQLIALDASNARYEFAEEDAGGKNAGENKPITASGFVLITSDLANAPVSNYDLVQPTGNTLQTLRATVLPRALTLTIVTRDTEYNKTRNADVDVSVTPLGSDDAQIKQTFSALYANENVALSDDVPPVPIAKQITITGIELEGDDAANYTVPSTDTSSSAIITPRPVTISNPTIAYNGQESGTVSFTISGRLANESLSATVFATWTGQGKDVGSKSMSFTPGNILLGLTDRNNYTISVETTSPLVGSVTQKRLRVNTTTFAPSSKVYDGTRIATLPDGDVPFASGWAPISGEGDVKFVRPEQFLFDSKNVGTNIRVRGNTNFTLTSDTSVTTNYVVDIQPTWTRNISVKTLTLIGSFAAADQTYDRGVTVDSLDLAPDPQNPLGLSGVENNEPISINTVAAEFTGTGDVVRDVDGDPLPQTVTLTQVALKTEDAVNAPISNYQVSLANTPLESKEATATILPKVVRAVPTASDKTYDGTLTATITAVALLDPDPDINASGLVSGDTTANVFISLPSIAAADRVFDQKDVADDIPVTVTLGALAGTRASNYDLANLVVTTVADINPRVLTLTGRFTAEGKPYDGTNSVTGLNLEPAGQTKLGLSGVQSDEEISIVSVSAQFAEDGDVKRVGGLVVAQTVTITDVALATSDEANAPLSNYRFNLEATPTASKQTSATIQPIPLTVTVSSPARIYNAGTDAKATTTVSLQDPTQLIAKDVGLVGVTFDTAVFNDPSVALADTVTVGGISTTGTRGFNYSVTATQTTGSSITPFELTIGPTGVNRPYDATPDAEVIWNLNEFGTDEVSVLYSASFPSKNVVYDNPSDRRNRQAISQAVTIVVTGLDGEDAGNYILPLDDNDTTITAYETSAVITPIALRVTGFDPNSKVYDGTDDATFTVREGEISYEGILNNEDVEFSSPEGIFDQADVGENIPVRLTTWSLTGDDQNNYTISIDRSITYANITPKDLHIDLTAQSRPYNGQTTATLDTPVIRLADVVAADRTDDTLAINPAKLQATATGDFLSGELGSGLDGSAGDNKLVQVTLTLSGTSAANYTPIPNDPRADITRKVIRAVPTAEDKTYDGTTTAVVSGIDLLETGSNLTGIETRAGELDDVSIDANALLAAQRVFAEKNVGSRQVTVTLTEESLQGADAGNYELENLVVTTTATITPREATVVGTFTAEPRPYNQGVDATVASLSNLTVTNLVDAGITIDPASVQAEFDTASAGENKVVSVTALSLQGTGVGNYTVVFDGITDYTAGVITPLTLTPTIWVEDRDWNGGVDAEIVSITVSGLLSNDQVSVDRANAIAQFRTRDQGTNKTVDVTNIRLIGAQAANYVLDLPETAPGVYSATTTASITGTPLFVTITSEGKVYDGSRDAQVTVSDDRIDGDVITISHDPAQFATSAVGDGIVVTITNIVVSGQDAERYVLANPGGLAETTASITPKPLGITAQSKEYDQTTAAILGLDGVVPGDTVTVTSSSATFDSKNVGTNKPVSADGLSLGGINAGNYSIAAQQTTTANITPRPLALTFTPNPPVTDVARGISVDITDNRITGDELTVTVTDASAIRRGNQLVLLVTGVQLTCDGLSDPCDSANYTTTGPYERVLRIFPAPAPRPTADRLQSDSPLVTAPLPSPSTRPGTVTPGVQNTETPSPAPARPAPGGPGANPGVTGGAPDILPGWRPPASPLATIDFGSGVVSRELDPREIANSIVVKAPEVVASEQFSGFAPRANAQIEIMGARTISELTIPEDGSVTINQLQQSFGRATLATAPDAPRVFPAASANGFDVPSAEEIDLLQDALAWLGLPDATRGPGLAPGNAIGEVVWQLEGFRPGSAVFLVATSEPSLVAWGVAGDEGVVSLRGSVLDTTLPPGDHRFRVVGTSVLGDVTTDQRGVTTISRDLDEYLAIFDSDTRVSVALWGANADGADHVAVRYIDPALTTPAPLWWWLLLPAMVWLMFVLWRRRTGRWNDPGPTAVAIAAGGVLIAPAVVAGVIIPDQRLLMPWGITVAIAVSLILVLSRHLDVGRRQAARRSSREDGPTPKLA